MAIFTKNVQFLIPDYLNDDFQAVCKMYGLTPTNVLRYYVWNTRNFFDKYSQGDIEKVQNLVLMGNAELVVAGARLLEGKDLHKKSDNLGKELGIIEE